MMDLSQNSVIKTIILMVWYTSRYLNFKLIRRKRQEVNLKFLYSKNIVNDKINRIFEAKSQDSIHILQLGTYLLKTCSRGSRRRSHTG